MKSNIQRKSLQNNKTPGRDIKIETVNMLGQIDFSILLSWQMTDVNKYLMVD